MVIVNYHGKRQVCKVLEYEKSKCQTHSSSRIVGKT
jgi:hypothetical protein